MPLAGRGLRPPSLRREVGRPQLKRDPLGSFPEAPMRHLVRLLIIAATCTPRIADGQSGSQPILALQLLGPPKVALEAGILAKPSPNRDWWPSASAGLGWAGGQVSLGIARRVGPRVDYGGPGAEFSVRIQASLLRTWAEPRYVQSRMTYAGADITITLPFLVGIRAGALHRIGGTGSSAWVTTFGLLVGWL